VGLYLAVFDDDEEEVAGLEVGSYADFNFFREKVVEVVEGGAFGTKCPVLINHSDCDGSWSPEESTRLIRELDMIEESFQLAAPVKIDVPWKVEIARSHGISPRNLLECFFDVDGEPLTERLRGLADVSSARKLPILFQ
jgi:hypothetical protein